MSEIREHIKQSYCENLLEIAFQIVVQGEDRAGGIVSELIYQVSLQNKKTYAQVFNDFVKIENEAIEIYSNYTPKKYDGLVWEDLQEWKGELEIYINRAI